MEPKKLSLGQRWAEARPPKAAIFWVCIGSVVLTLIVGFTWGGWVSGGTARSMANTMAEEAVTKRLAPMCVVQVSRDPAKDQKLKEMKEKSSYERGDFVKAQGWAKMPGDTETDAKVAEECARLLMERTS
jgi:hypothetical protein